MSAGSTSWSSRLSEPFAASFCRTSCREPLDPVPRDLSAEERRVHRGGGTALTRTPAERAGQLVGRLAFEEQKGRSVPRDPRAATDPRLALAPLTTTGPGG
jgi:hypothetical protein